MSKQKTTYAIVLRRENGRYVKTLSVAYSRYAAKKAVQFYEGKYDHTYKIVVEEKR